MRHRRPHAGNAEHLTPRRWRRFPIAHARILEHEQRAARAHVVEDSLLGGQALHASRGEQDGLRTGGDWDGFLERMALETFFLLLQHGLGVMPCEHARHLRRVVKDDKMIPCDVRRLTPGLLRRHALVCRIAK